MKQDRIVVEPSVLRWARKNSNLDIAAVAKKVSTTQEIVSSWETGDLSPTIAQLRKLGEIYRRPLAVLLLSSPPEDFQAIRDFRSRKHDADSGYSPDLISEIRRGLEQRDLYLDLDELASGLTPDSRPLPKLKLNSDIEKSGQAIRSWIGLDDFQFQSGRMRARFLSECIERVEEFGIMVIFVSRVPIDEMRGFSLSFEKFPIIGLNVGDSPKAQAFTLFHEIAHLGLRTDGLCELDEGSRPNDVSGEIERFCNRTAASALVPDNELRNLIQIHDDKNLPNWSLDEISQLSAQFGVSSEVLIIRLVSIGAAKSDLYTSLKPTLDQIYAGELKKKKQQQEKARGGPNFYAVKAKQLGKRFVSTVLNAHDLNHLSSSQASGYLGVKYEKLSGFRSRKRGTQ